MRQLSATASTATQLLEVITPRTNAARLSPAEHLFGAIGVHASMNDGPVAFEIAGDQERRRFLVRTGSRGQQQRVAAQLGAAYPQAALRPSETTTLVADPAQLGPDEQVLAATMRLRVGAHLPLRMLEDRELDATATSAHADPLLGVLGAMANLPAGWRIITQLVLLRPAPADWARAHQRLALERPLEQERARDTGPSLLGPLAVLGLLVAYLIGASVIDAWARGDVFAVLSLVIGIVAVAIAGLVLIRWLRPRDLVDPRLVQAKLSRDACEAELRLAVSRLISWTRPRSMTACTASRPPTDRTRLRQVTAWSRRPSAWTTSTCAYWIPLTAPACSMCKNWPGSGTSFRPTTT